MPKWHFYLLHFGGGKHKCVGAPGGGGVGGGIYADFNCTWTRCHMNDQKLTDTYTSSINLNCDANRRHQKSSIKHQTMWRSPVKFTWCTQILSTTTVIQTMLMLGGSSRAILDNYNVRRDGEFQKRWRIPEEVENSRRDGFTLPSPLRTPLDSNTTGFTSTPALCRV